MRDFIFSLVFLSVMGTANYYIYRRFFMSLQQVAQLRQAGTVTDDAGESFFVWDIATGLIPDSPLL